MAPRHGTRQRYGGGCRCDACKYAQRVYQKRWRERRANGETRPVMVQLPPAELAPAEPGLVELAVESEVGGLAEARPTLVAVAVAMARILDNSRAPAPKPAAAKVLVSVLDALHKSAQGRRGSLAAVRSLTERGQRPRARQPAAQTRSGDCESVFTG